MSVETEQPLNERQRAILQALYTFRFLDTSGVRQVLDPQMSRQAVHALMRRLDARGLIISHTTALATYYSLTKSGALAIGQRIKTQHYKLPSPRVFAATTRALQIEREATQRGLTIYRATPASALNPVQAVQHYTRQVVVQHWLLAEQQLVAHDRAAGRDTGTRGADARAGLHPIPIVFREYYMHPPHRPGVIVILSAPQTDRRFWLARRDQLKDVPPAVPVLCVFAKMPPADLVTELKKVGFQATLLENFGDALDTLF